MRAAFYTEDCRARRGLFWALLLPLLLSCFSKNEKQTAIRRIPVADLQYDFRVLRQTLEEGHPGLYWYTDKQRMDRFFDSVYGTLNHPLTEVEFLKTVLPVIANIRCVHTNVSIAGEGIAAQMKTATFLPLDLFFVQGNAYVRESFAGERWGVRRY